MISTALHLLFLEKKKALNLFASLTFLYSISLFIIQMLNNPIFLMDGGMMNALGISLLSLSLFLVCISLLGYSCLYYIKQNQKEVALLHLSGYREYQIVFYLLIKIGVICLFALLVSILTGWILISIILFIFYYFMHINQSFFPSSLYIIQFLSTIIPGVLIVLLAIICRFVYGKNIPDLLKEETELYSEDKRLVRLPDFFYTFMYLIGMYCVFIDHYLTPTFSIATFIGAIGAYGIFYIFVPHIITEVLNDLNIQTITYVIMGNLSVLMKQSRLLVLFIMGNTIFIPSFIYAIDTDSGMAILLHIVLIIMNCSLAFTLVSRFQLDMMRKQSLYKELSYLGFENEEVIQISKKETKYFYIILFTLVLLYYLGITILFIIRKQLSLSIPILVFIEILLPYSISLWIINRKKKGALKWLL